MPKSYFPEIERIVYEGPESDRRLAFHHYDAEREVLGKTMAEHLRFAVAYWHSMTSLGSDNFGEPTMRRAYLDHDDAMAMARARLDFAFELFAKLGVEWFCFHDTDLAPEGETLAESLKRTDEMVALVERKMKETGVKVLFGSQNLFESRRFMSGAYTARSPEVFAWAAAKAKKMLEVCHQLGAQGQAFWGGREGYDTLLDTDLAREQDLEARFFELVLDHKRKIGFEGDLYIEPKPREPLRRQWDYDVAAVHAFLQRYGLVGKIRVNLEANHALLASTAFLHEIRYAFANDLFGSLDANRGDPLVGWDTDQFPTNLYQTTLVMHELLVHGGFTKGGLNFDAKLRRQSVDPVDLFHAHVGAMDCYARGLEIAAQMVEDEVLERAVHHRYRGWENELGTAIREGRTDLESLQRRALELGEPQLESGRQEMLENLLNHYVFGDASTSDARRSSSLARERLAEEVGRSR